MPPTTPPPNTSPACSTNSDQKELRHSLSVSSMQTTCAPVGAMMAVHAVVAQPCFPQYAIPDYDMETAPGEAPYGPFFVAHTPDSDRKFLAKNDARYVGRLALLCCVVVL